MADEKVDLDDVRQREINALEAKVSNPNHFTVLGVANGASDDEVRTAFRELSLKFHPDRYFGKRLGPFKQKLDRVFQRLVEANQTLTDADRRAAWIAANPGLGLAAAPTRSTPSSIAREQTQLSRDEERRRRLAHHPYLSKATRQIELVQRVKQHIAKGEFSLGFSLVNQASQADPNNAELKVLLAEARKHMDHGRAEENYKRAMTALEVGEDDVAISALKSAVSAEASHHVAAYKLAQLLERRGADPRESTGYAQKAVDAEPTNADYRLLLARLLGAAGMKALAKKHADEAARLGGGKKKS